MVQIGEVSARTGMSRDALRFYERVGLVPLVARSPNGRRQYTEEDLARLRFIQRSKLLGLSLDEIGSLLAVADEGDCRPVRKLVVDLLHEKIRRCDEQLAELAALREDLAGRYRLALENAESPACDDCGASAEDCGCLPVGADEIEPRAGTGREVHG